MIRPSDACWSEVTTTRGTRSSRIEMEVDGIVISLSYCFGRAWVVLPQCPPFLSSVYILTWEIQETIVFPQDFKTPFKKSVVYIWNRSLWWLCCLSLGRWFTLIIGRGCQRPCSLPYEHWHNAIMNLLLSNTIWWYVVWHRHDILLLHEDCVQLWPTEPLTWPLHKYKRLMGPCISRIQSYS